MKELSDLINRQLNQHAKEKDDLIRSVMSEIAPNATIDDFSSKGRLEIYPEKEVYFWNNIAILEVFKLTSEINESGGRFVLTSSFKYRRLV